MAFLLPVCATGWIWLSLYLKARSFVHIEHNMNTYSAAGAIEIFVAVDVFVTRV